MADQEEQQPHSLASTFPNPPPFWKDFTPERVAQIEDLRVRYLDANGEHDSSKAVKHRIVSIPSLPEDLKILQPPVEPINGKWRVFGDFYTLDDQLPTLQDQGILPLSTTLPNPPTPSTESMPYDRAFELKRLTKSLLLNFLELVGVLSYSAPSAENKIQDLRTIFINLHHVINEYRPHQARESVIELMSEHLDRTRRETRGLREVADRAKRVLESLGSLGILEVNKDGFDVRTDKDEGKGEGEVWREVDGLLG